MSTFLDEIRDQISGCQLDAYDEEGDTIHNRYEIAETISRIDSLGENARRMLEIGILQDELAKLGFKQRRHINRFVYNSSHERIYVEFLNDGVFLLGFGLYSYNLPDFAQDVLTKVKELINHDFKKDSTCK